MTTNTVTQTPPKKHQWPIFAIIAIILAFLIWQFFPRKVTSDNPSAPTVTHTPIVYDVQNWQVAQKSDITQATALIGTAGTADTGLDIDGNTANITRFHSLQEPPLTLGISDKYIELNWYYAPATDSDDNKTISLNYAKKAHAFATALLGTPAHDTIQSMLTTAGQDFAKPPMRIAMCKHYQCQLVLDKTALN